MNKISDVIVKGDAPGELNNPTWHFEKHQFKSVYRL
tara:strand:+ start:679 stop:786 length:108 start_codon:yes stop_codon:yes gene_type:complete